MGRCDLHDIEPQVDQIPDLLIDLVDRPQFDGNTRPFLFREVGSNTAGYIAFGPVDVQSGGEDTRAHSSPRCYVVPIAQAV